MLDGRYFSIGSSITTIPFFTNYDKIKVVNVFVMEPILKRVSPSTGILFAFDMFPKLNTFVPFGSTNPTTRAAFDLLTI
jgi:hypothetical protein